ncbi:FAD-dependent oxidoreductase, partial [Desulfovibrio piger]
MKRLTVIGGGPGGYTAAFAAARAGMEVTLVEAAHLGGTCLNSGCIPTKTFLKTADMIRDIHKAVQHGVINDPATSVDM